DGLLAHDLKRVVVDRATVRVPFAFHARIVSCNDNTYENVSILTVPTILPQGTPSFGEACPS
ncbi:MAG: hypothetical protein RBT67_09515, partial [Thauera sp.]|nr:hypothetical protein [Thauera sp.]